MIIRNRVNEWVMISQHDHAEVAGQIAKQIKDELFPGLAKRPSVELAIREHDRAWIPVDQHPIMNDVKEVPYSFIDFPLTYKSVIYKHGIDEVEVIDPYAALLCSYHYEQFMVNHSENVSVVSFLEHEKKRQDRILSQLSDINKEEIASHFALLKFCDNLSLYICLNEPSNTKAQAHPFFQQGIKSPFEDDKLIQPFWCDEQTIQITPFSLTQSIDVSLKQKVVSKERAIEEGIALAYGQTPFETVKIKLTEKS